MARVAKGTITFLYNLDEDPFFEQLEENGQVSTDEERLDYFRECMAEDLASMNVYEAIEMTIEEEEK